MRVPELCRQEEAQYLNDRVVPSFTGNTSVLCMFSFLSSALFVISLLRESGRRVNLYVFRPVKNRVIVPIFPILLLLLLILLVLL